VGQILNIREIPFKIRCNSFLTENSKWRMWTPFCSFLELPEMFFKMRCNVQRPTCNCTSDMQLHARHATAPPTCNCTSDMQLHARHAIAPPTCNCRLKLHQNCILLVALLRLRTILLRVNLIRCKEEAAV